MKLFTIISLSVVMLISCSFSGVTNSISITKDKKVAIGDSISSVKGVKEYDFDICDMSPTEFRKYELLDTIDGGEVIREIDFLVSNERIIAVDLDLTFLSSLMDKKKADIKLDSLRRVLIKEIGSVTLIESKKYNELQMEEYYCDNNLFISFSRFLIGKEDAERWCISFGIYDKGLINFGGCLRNRYKHGCEN